MFQIVAATDIGAGGAAAATAGDYIKWCLRRCVTRTSSLIKALQNGKLRIKQGCCIRTALHLHESFFDSALILAEEASKEELIRVQRHMAP